MIWGYPYSWKHPYHVLIKVGCSHVLSTLIYDRKARAAGTLAFLELCFGTTQDSASWDCRRMWPMGSECLQRGRHCYSYSSKFFWCYADLMLEVSQTADICFQVHPKLYQYHGQDCSEKTCVIYKGAKALTRIGSRYSPFSVGPHHLSNEKKHCCLGYVGDYTTQLCGDYNKV